MTTLSEEYNDLTIQLLSYDRPAELTERYYFLEMSTLQATQLLPPDKKIVAADIAAYSSDNIQLNKEKNRGL